MSDRDAYEQEYMAGGEVLHRDKLQFPIWLHFVFLIVAILAIVLPMTSPGTPWFIPIVTGSASGLAWLNFSALRVVVTEDVVDLKYGLIGPTIDVEKIVHCEAEEYSIWQYGGYGIRFSPLNGTWAFNMIGDKGQAVRIHYKTSLGVRKLIVATNQPEVLANAINRARASMGHDVPAEPLEQTDEEVVFEETASLQSDEDSEGRGDDASVAAEEEAAASVE